MNKLFMLAGCFLFVSLAGCLKKDRTKTPEATLETGSWKLVQLATDDNHNLKLDPNEIKDVASGYLETLQFNKDYSGQQTVTASGNTTLYAYTWQIFGSSPLQINFVGHDTVVYDVITLTNSTLTLMDSTSVNSDSSVLTWHFYKNQ